jgi:hypothetical protein
MQKSRAFHAARSGQFSSWLQLEAANLIGRKVVRAGLAAKSASISRNGRFAQQRDSQHVVVFRLA